MVNPALSRRRNCFENVYYRIQEEISRVGGHYAVQGHSRSLILLPIESYSSPMRLPVSGWYCGHNRKTELVLAGPKINECSVRVGHILHQQIYICRFWLLPLTKCDIYYSETTRNQLKSVVILFYRQIDHCFCHKLQSSKNMAPTTALCGVDGCLRPRPTTRRDGL